MSEFTIMDYEEIEAEIWGNPKPKPQPKVECGEIHLFYCILIGMLILVPSCMSWVDSWDRESCERLCEPYRTESCGPDARTATCRTPEGYVVRTKPPIVPLKGR